MARMKLTAKKHVRAPPRRDAIPTESHSDGQKAGYFLLALGSSEPPLFIGIPRLLCGNSYLWHMRVVIYEWSTTDRIRRIHQVVEAPAPRWTFEAGMREAAREALAVLRHEADKQMAHSEYRHFPSRDHMGCFTNQVKMTRALVQNLDEAVKEVKLLGEHGEDSSRKITELEALCQRLRDYTQRLEEEKATFEEMVESHDELLMEIARETGLDHMDEDEGEEEEMDNEGDVAAPLPLHHHPWRPLLTY
jgi:hypothetical protein